ncbi:MAG TPA: PBP1A family penicillin-binding protein [Blastocatellia bacterium]|nr:PBP1A family penicillin-binding protein [Blastocatellia bacterium]
MKPNRVPSAAPQVYYKKSLWRRIFKPWVLVFFGGLTFIALAVFGYYYVLFSGMIDSRLKGGDVIVRTTSIYAAPYRVQSGRAIAKQDLISHLDKVGYVDLSKGGDTNRGRYLVKGNDVEVIPGSDNSDFPHIKVTFNGRSIDRVYDVNEKKTIAAAYVEPEMLTSVTGDKKEKRKVIEYNDLPKNLVNAILAAEDRDFFKHPGVNYKGLIRALLRDTQEGELRQGGSTITQQLAKNMFLTRERTFKRKLADIYLALILETRLTKQQIFTLYCNEVPMGQQGNYSINGMGEAARIYFGKDVMNLNLAESAFLAGILRGTTYYSPYSHLDRAVARRNEILDAMVKMEVVTQDDADKAKKTDVKILSRALSTSAEAPYFLDYLDSSITDAMAGKDLSRTNYRVYSTVDMDLQRAADSAVRTQMAALDKVFTSRKKNGIPADQIQTLLQAALVAIDPKTGEILAMVGGRDYSTSQLNRATDAHRQPGSVFKPIVYATALNTAYDEGSDKVITPASLFMDAPATFNYDNNKTYSPSNFGEEFTNHDVTVRYALTHSLNVVTVKVAEKVGYSKVAKMAESFGLPRPQPVPSLALGTYEATPLEVARAYTTFPNNGVRVEPYGLRKITTRSGDAVMGEPSVKKKQVITPEVSWILTNIMQDVLNSGTAARARQMGFTALAAGKTGSSFDGWFAGFTPNLVCVVWVGFDDNRQLGLTGAQSALPIWVDFMKKALAIRPDLAGTEFTQPSGVTEADIDPGTGLLASEICGPGRKEYFIAATAPTEQCTQPAQPKAQISASNAGNDRNQSTPGKSLPAKVTGLLTREVRRIVSNKH